MLPGTHQPHPMHDVIVPMVILDPLVGGAGGGQERMLAAASGL